VPGRRACGVVSSSPRQSIQKEVTIWVASRRSKLTLKLPDSSVLLYVLCVVEFYGCTCSLNIECRTDGKPIVPSSGKNSNF
jgi:hypothetical protein